jgi:hypothetical protein
MMPAAAGEAAAGQRARTTMMESNMHRHTDVRRHGTRSVIPVYSTAAVSTGRGSAAPVARMHHVPVLVKATVLFVYSVLKAREKLS